MENNGATANKHQTLYFTPQKCQYTPMRCSKITRLQRLAASPESKVFPESWATKSNQSPMLLQNVLDACSSSFLSFNFTPAQKNQYGQLKPTAVDPPQCAPPVLGRGSFAGTFIIVRRLEPCRWAAPQTGPGRGRVPHEALCLSVSSEMQRHPWMLLSSNSFPNLGPNLSSLLLPALVTFLWKPFRTVGIWRRPSFGADAKALVAARANAFSDRF